MDKRTFDDFDEFAQDYRSIHNNNIKLSGADSFYFAEMKVMHLQKFEKAATLNVLDVGCGDGLTEEIMHSHFPNWKVLGIDVSEQSIQVAQQKNIPGIEFKLYDGIHIPLEDNAVSIVFVAGVLHHVQYELHKPLLKEINRVLKTDGRLYIFEHNSFNPLTKYLVKTCVFDKDAKLLKPGYTSRLLAENGFTIADKSFQIFFPRKGLLSKFIFLEKYLNWLPLGGQYFIRAIKKD